MHAMHILFIFGLYRVLCIPNVFDFDKNEIYIKNFRCVCFYICSRFICCTGAISTIFRAHFFNWFPFVRSFWKIKSINKKIKCAWMCICYVHVYSGAYSVCFVFQTKKFPITTSREWTNKRVCVCVDAIENTRDTTHRWCVLRVFYAVFTSFSFSCGIYWNFILGSVLNPYIFYASFLAYVCILAYVCVWRKKNRI